MTEINTITIITAMSDSADQVERALAILDGAACNDHGRPRYTSHRSLEDPHVFITIERWNSQESVAAHQNPPHLVQVLADIDHLLAAPPQVIYTRAPDDLDGVGGVDGFDGHARAVDGRQVIAV